MKKNVIIRISVIAVILLAAACITLVLLLGNKKPEAPKEYVEDRTLEDFNDKQIGVMVGSVYERIVSERFPDAKLNFFSKVGDMVSAVVDDKIDAFVCSDIQANSFVAEYDQIKILDRLPDVSVVAFAFPKTEKGELIRDEFNAYLAKIKADGTFDEMNEKWKDGGDKIVEISVAENSKGVLRMATTGTTEPYTYMSQSRLTGFDIDLAARFSQEYNYDLDIHVMNFGEIIPGLTEGEYDIAGANITVTPERSESVLFSDSYTSNGTAFVVKTVPASFTG